MKLFALLLLILPLQSSAQNTQDVADQTFKLNGKTQYVYAFAEGDVLDLMVQELTGKELKSIEFLQFPDHMIFRAYELDSVLTKSLVIPQTGIYLIRFQEVGMSKKVCRFTLHRTPASMETARFNTTVPWDIDEYPDFQVIKKSVQSGTKTEMVSISGQVTVSAKKFYLSNPVNAWQFSLPPNTRQWAYRISVGQAVNQARKEDAQKLTQAFQVGSAKLLKIQPHTALAAFALGMAIDLTVSKSGEDVEYAITDWDNWKKFSEGKDYKAYIQQGNVSVDVQRRYTPLQGTYWFALKSDNWVDDIDVSIEIEAVTEVPLFETELHLQPIKP
ncbi:MAG: hypothetical protein H6576_03870 [Lewinellaceae bacterium]|nr:hypothetical protein [Saprospiraceae bacterium]MCB9342804.1 hypothetical protein [Lewinellaceae bacterium]